MNRREWFKRATRLVAAGVAADQLELIERLGWTRSLFPSASIAAPLTATEIVHINREFSLGFVITRKTIENDWYAQSMKHYKGGIIDIAHDKDAFLFLTAGGGRPA